MTQHTLISTFRAHYHELIRTVQHLRVTGKRHCFEKDGWNAVYDKAQHRFVSLTAFGEEGLFVRIKL